MHSAEPGAISLDDLREALRNWSKPAGLASHPLQHLTLVKIQQRQTGCDPERALRKVILHAIDQFRAPNWESDPGPRNGAARRHAILVQHFLRGKTLRQLADELSVDERTCRRDLAQALGDLARLLAALEQNAQQDERTRAAPPLEVVPPLAPHAFWVGRDGLFQRLSAALEPDGRTVAVHGLPGAGKTSLLVHLAHAAAVRQRFSDGVLWANLGEQPNIAFILRTWALALGLGPADVEQLSALGILDQAVRARLLNRRVLIVLNDVWQVEHARALQLAGPTACYLVSAYAPRLAVEAASPGLVFEVTGLSVEEGVQLLSAFIPQAARAFPKEMAVLVERCDGLPLALTLVGRYLARAFQSGSWPRLQRELLRLLDQQPDAGVASLVQSAFARLLKASLSRLTSEQRAALYALTAIPPRSAVFDEAAFRIITGQSEQALDALLDVGLVAGDRAGYYLHALVHAALTQGEEAEVAAARRAGQARLLSYALEQPTALFAQSPHRKLSVPDCAPMLAAASIRAAISLNDTAGCLRLATLALPYLRRHGLLNLADLLLEAATRGGAPDAPWARLVAERCMVLTELGHAQAARELLASLRRWAAGQPGQCHAYILAARATLALRASRLSLAYALARRGWRCLGDHLESDADLALELLQLQARALANLGRYADAVRVNRRLLRLARQHHLIEKTVAALYILAVLMRQQSQHESAMRYVRRALALARKSNHRYYATLSLTFLGMLANDQGDHDVAMLAFAEAEPLAKSLGLPMPLYQLRHAQGVLAMRRARWQEAEACLNEAFAHAQSADQKLLMANVQIEIGECLLAQGGLAESGRHLRSGLAVAEAIGAQDIAALLRYNLARLAQAYGQEEQARELGRQAYAQLRASSHYRADEVGRWLRTLPQAR